MSADDRSRPRRITRERANLKDRLTMIADSVHATADASAHPRQFGGSPVSVGQDLEGLAANLAELIPLVPAAQREEAGAICETLRRSGSFAQDYKALIRSGPSWANGVRSSASRIYGLIGQL